MIVTADHGTGGFTFTYGDFDGMPAPTTLPSGVTYEPHHRYPYASHVAALRRQSASYEQMLRVAGGSPEKLIDAVKEHTGFTMTRDEARRALERDADGNAWTDDFRHFYGDQESNPSCLLGRALARHTFVVWATGGHTTEPVLTFGVGPGAEGLRGVYENTRVYDVVKGTLAAAHP